MRLCGLWLSSSWVSRWICWSLSEKCMALPSSVVLDVASSFCLLPCLPSMEGRGTRVQSLCLWPLFTFYFASPNKNTYLLPLEKIFTIKEKEKKGRYFRSQNTDPEPSGRVCVGIKSLKKSKIICASSWNALTSAVGNSITIYPNVHLLLIFDKYFHVAVWACLDGNVTIIFIKLILMDTWNKNDIY